ncbi:MAG: TIGR04283 family arsenosugar biosynthesis glycosyltransferase [Balneolaceae bacterium]
MNNRSVSIIIPAWNEEENLKKLLPVITKRQSGAILEIIVADGGSKDGTVQIAEKAGAKVIHCHKKRRAVQMNEGASHARGEILFFLHADTLPPPSFDSKIISESEKGAVSGCFQLRFDENRPALKFYSWFTKWKTTFVRFGDQGLFVEKKAFDQSGGFDESLTVMEDQEMVRVLKRKGNFSLLDSAVVTSARKYRRSGYLRLQLVFTLIFILYYTGAKQETLVHLYNSFIKS